MLDEWLKISNYEGRGEDKCWRLVPETVSSLPFSYNIKSQPKSRTLESPLSHPKHIRKTQWWRKNLLFKGQMSWLTKINRTFVLVTKAAIILPVQISDQLPWENMPRTSANRKREITRNSRNDLCVVWAWQGLQNVYSIFFNMIPVRFNLVKTSDV